jgi:putative oxidoreductase
MQFLEKLKPLALLFLRWGIAIIFLFHGYPKLAHIRQWIQNFQHMGFPGYFAYVAGVFEVFGSVLLIVGLFTRISALLLAGEMAVAIWRVHLPQGTVFDVGNYQLPLALAVGSFAIATVGAGLFSLDHLIFGAGRAAFRRSKPKDSR